MGRNWTNSLHGERELQYIGFLQSTPTEPAMCHWAVHTRITAREQTEIRLFGDLAEAERFVKKNRGNWRSPVPVVSVCQPNLTAFSGPALRTWLKIDRNDDPTKLPFEEYCDRVFRDIALDGAAPVMQKLEQEGLLQPGDPSAPFGASRITPAELKVILDRIGELALPEVHCSLGLDWDFITLKLNAEHLGGHVQLLPRGLNLFSLAEVVFDLEDALRSRFTGLTIVDVFNFWTSVEVHDHIAEVCRRSVEVMDPRSVEQIREEMARRLGSYAHTVRNVEAVQPATSQEPHRTELHVTVNIENAATGPFKEPDVPAPIDRNEVAVSGRSTLAAAKEGDSQASLAAGRQAVVIPILNKRRWKRGKWATVAGVGKNSVYEYLDGKRKLTDENRRAMAEAIGLKPEELPD